MLSGCQLHSVSKQGGELAFVEQDEARTVQFKENLVYACCVNVLYVVTEGPSDRRSDVRPVGPEGSQPNSW